MAYQFSSLLLPHKLPTAVATKLEAHGQQAPCSPKNYLFSLAPSNFLGFFF